MNDKKIMNFIYISLIIPIILLISIFLFFFFSVNKVYAISTTYGLNSVSIGNDTSGTSANTPINTWFNYGPNLNYINGYFTGHNGSFNGHILVELNYGEAVNPNSNAQIVILAYLDNNLLSGSSGNCPKVATGKYNCDLYISGSNDSNNSVIALQLKTIGTYYTNHVISVRVSGSITYDDSTANLNNGSFNQGISSINSNISGASSEIIGNQNQNTQDIINNQNANNQALQDKIEEQYNVCETKTIEFVKTKQGYYLESNGVEASNSSYDISNYVEINQNKSYTLNNLYGNTVAYCLYPTNSNVSPTCESIANRTSITFNSGTNNYVRVSIRKSATTIPSISGQYCYNMLEKQNQTSENIENALTDSSVTDPSNSLNGLNANIGTNSVISDLLLLPVTLYQSVLNNINGTCSAFTLGSMFNHTLRMPCLNISGVIGSSIYGIIDVLISGFFILSIRKKFVDIFNHFTSLKVGGNELE